MYGLVNKAIQDMVCSRFRQETWEEIKQKAEVEVDVFISMQGYPDDMTHKLVKAASVVLNLSPSEIMQAFGEYWVQYTASEGYGEIMDMTGDKLPEFLENLDNLHARVGASFPELKPPSFECHHMEEDSLNLHYRSTREGLTPMIIGLIKGLGTRFDTEVDITQTQSRDEGAEHDEFLVKYKPN
ncbi:MAG: heme NO-binding domain-containing protein [Stigonema ocellatum SAG 48.90 = DSM 106950]|nr:heme NO-binding domain-containing protein [Stigonema ocellatum SAG 48.90 = DSM 106950]